FCLSATASAALATSASDTEDIKHHCKDAAGGNDCDDAADDGFGRRIADCRRAASRLHAAQTAEQCNQHAVDRSLEDAAEKVVELHRPLRVLVVGNRRAPEAEDADRCAA